VRPDSPSLYRKYAADARIINEVSWRVEALDAVLDWLRISDSREMLVFVTAMLPVVELRGAIPLGLSLGMPPMEVFFLSVLGNIVPIVPIMLFLRYVAGRLRRFRWFRHASEEFFKKVRARSDVIQRYGPLGLVVFVAVPLPSTGAWTASVAAFLLGIRIRYSFVSISIGTILAGVIVTYLSCQVL
jgi:uncharacterized membrane protein